MTTGQGEVEVLPLRRVAARFIARSEQDGLDTLDALTSALFAQVRWRYQIWLFVVFVATLAFGTAIAVSVIIAIGNAAYGNLMIGAVLVLLLLYYAVVSSWRWYQYGVGFERKPRVALYANADSTTAKNLDRFFSVMQRETTRRAFYNAGSGSQRDVNRQQFFGSLRVLMLSEHDWVREPVFSTKGMWFARELFMKADVATLIAEAQAKPKAGGRPKQIDYEAILLELLEQKRLHAIDPDERGSESQMMGLIHALCDASEEHDTDIRVPESTELRVFAKKVLNSVRKNRARKK